MKKDWHSEEEIVGILKQHEAGAKMVELRREHGISAVTLHTWRRKFGGMNLSEALQLTAVEDELCRLKGLVAEAEAQRREVKRGHPNARLPPETDLPDDLVRLARQKLQALRSRRSRSRA